MEQINTYIKYFTDLDYQIAEEQKEWQEDGTSLSETLYTATKVEEKSFTLIMRGDITDRMGLIESKCEFSQSIIDADDVCIIEEELIIESDGETSDIVDRIGIQWNKLTLFVSANMEYKVIVK